MPTLSPSAPPLSPQVSTTDRQGEAPFQRDATPIKPNFVRQTADASEADGQAPASLAPRLERPEYFCKPSVEMMAQMSEDQLKRVDNLEVGRHGYGHVMWPGLTDVRGMNFDQDVKIDRYQLEIYPGVDKPKINDKLNKPAVICLHVKPSKNSDDSERQDRVLREKLEEISANYGGEFIDYVDREKWFFRMPHFNGASSEK